MQSWCTLYYKTFPEQETEISEHRVIMESLIKKIYVIIFLRQEHHQ